ncbi:hypothetical protein [Streptomyces sp. NPDC057582]|uniref:hypothetical protein n=1 Tax=Streptomyces sp. NPDC057582 TaxID=3346174 RepID=UPI0036CCABBC
MHRITTAPVAPIPARTRWAVAAGVGAVLAAAWWLGDTAPYPYAQRGLLELKGGRLALAEATSTPELPQPTRSED